MQSLLLTWLSVVLFVGTLFWSTNVPTSRRSPVLFSLVIGLLLFNLFAQGSLFDTSPVTTKGLLASHFSDDAALKLHDFLLKYAMLPGGLRHVPYINWYRVISSSLLHYGWMQLLFNLWFLVMLGRALEQGIGSLKFLAVVTCGLIVPAALDGLFPFPHINPQGFTGGFSGVVYAVIGAYLMCFPRSRCYGAVVYDLRYWAIILCIFLPVTLVTRFGGLALTEMVIVLGTVGVFLLVQPEHIAFSAPAGAILVYKLVQDVVLIQPATGALLSNSVWRIGGGLLVGVCAGFLCSGTRGWKLTWVDETKKRVPAKRATGRSSVAQLEAEGQKSLKAARVFLGQRVFVGDATRASNFYRDVVIPKFPELVLPPQEQIALARLLQFRGLDFESLHAYELILKTDPLPEEYWLAWLKAAEYIVRLQPNRCHDALHYLDRFEQGTNNLMRDRIEAERLRDMLTAGDKPVSGNGPAGQPPAISGVTTALTLGPKPEAHGPTDPVLGVPVAAKAGSRRGPVANPPLEFPRLAPRTFRYSSGETVSLNAQRLRRPASTFVPPGDSIKTFWSPLPCINENRSFPSMLDRPVKSVSFSPESRDKVTLYGTSADSTRKKSSAGNRLSKLELLRNELVSILPVPVERSATYGVGRLDDKTTSSPNLRLRGENELPVRIGNRARPRNPADLRESWGKKLAPADRIAGEKSYKGDTISDPET